MKKTYYISFVILIFLGHFTFTYAISGGIKNAGKILDNFKEKQYDLIFEVNLGDIKDNFFDVFKSSNKINIYENISVETKEKRQSVQVKNEKIIEKITSLEESIKQIDDEISKANLKVKNINNEVINTKNEIEVNTKTVNFIKDKIDNSTDILLKYLEYIYKKTNTVYDNGDIDNLKSILLNGDNIGSIIDDLYYNGIIQITGKKLIEKHKDYIKELYQKQLELEKEKEDLVMLRKMGIIEKKTLDEKKEYKGRILDISKGQQVLYEKYIIDKIKIENSLRLKAIKERIKYNSLRDDMLEQYGCSYDNVSDDNSIQTLTGTCLDIKKIIDAEAKLKNYKNNDSNNFLEWPIPPFSGITAYFNDENYLKTFGSEHEGIDIKVSQGTGIKAPSDGYVIHVEKPISQSYSFVVLKHADGYISVYGHLSDVFIEKYDYITKGQVFALTGGEYGTLGAGFLTTGPHLHFEVYKDAEYIDPLLVLDISYLQFHNLPKKYQYKYYIDFKERKGYDYKDFNRNSSVFRLEGETEAERQKSLIRNYAMGGFNNWQMWVDESLYANIDPSFAMCVGVAETGLGKNMKTPYNIGNVGNTDSGATKSFTSPATGLYWMLQTFNNKYLGHYNKISDLSRYGNKDGTIYASSDYNWHKNVVTCMTSLKGRFIPDDYNFRIIKN